MLAFSSPTWYHQITAVELMLYRHVTKLVTPPYPSVTICDALSNTPLPLGASRML